MSRKRPDKHDLLTRRDAIKLGSVGLAAGAFTLTAGGSAIAQQTALPPVPGTGPGHVIKVHKPGMVGRWFPHAEAAADDHYRDGKRFFNQMRYSDAVRFL